MLWNSKWNVKRHEMSNVMRCQLLKKWGKVRKFWRKVISQTAERFKFSCRLSIIETIYIWCKKRMFLIIFLAALPPCRQCFHRTAQHDSLAKIQKTYLWEAFREALRYKNRCLFYFLGKRWLNVPRFVSFCGQLPIHIQIWPPHLNSLPAPSKMCENINFCVWGLPLSYSSVWWS